MKKITYVIILCLFLLTFFSACSNSGDSKNSSVSIKEVIEKLENHNLETEIEQNILFEMSKNKSGYYVAYDVQVLPLLEDYSEIYWYPLYTKTVVLSIDSNVVKQEIKSFSDLENIETPVIFAYNNLLEEEYRILAVDYGLNGESLSLDRTIDLFNSLREKDLFYPEKNSNVMAGVIISTDDDVVLHNQKGNKRDIVIPEDGTISYGVGIVSLQPLEDFDVITEDMLVQMGYRVENGTCDRSLYPSHDAYKNSSKLALNSNRFDAIKELSGSWARKVKWSHFLPTASDKDHLTAYMIFSIVLIIWGGSIYYRVTQKPVRRAITISYTLLLVWLALQVVRTLAFEPILERYAWYLWYGTIIYNVFTILYVAVHVNGEKLKWTWDVGMIMGSIFFALVMTNDLHQWIFSFPKELQNAAYEYDYEVGFFLLAIFLFAYVFFAFGLLAYKSSQSKISLTAISVWFPPILMLVYIYLYVTKTTFEVLNWEIALYKMEIVLFQILLICLNWELHILSGLIPTNGRYHHLFQNSGMSIQITDQEGKVAFESKESKNILQKNTMYMNKKLEYGTVIWKIDMTDLNEIQEELTETEIRLREQSELLQQENEIESDLVSIKIQNEILHNMNQGFKEKLDYAIERVRAVVDGDRSEAEATTAYAEMLLVYIKNRGYLLLHGMTEQRIRIEALRKAIKGAVYSANFIGLTCDFSMHVVRERIDYLEALLLYDCVEEVLERVVFQPSSVLVIFVEEVEGQIILRILIDGNMEMENNPKLVEDVNRVQAEIDIQQDEDGVHFLLSLPKEVE